MTKIRVLISDSYNPWFNLATENWIFRDMDPETRTLFLWRNKDTVVIGRFQNPWTECKVQKMEEDNIVLARRQSGGGAVFHDLGNTNFTFLNAKTENFKDINNTIICNALKSLGIEAKATGRNDITVELEDGTKKISGSAFKESRDRAFHHGTMLINANMQKLGHYLTPSKKKLESKGIKSVKARVTNLIDIKNDITHDDFCNAMIQEFFNYYGTECEIEHLHTEDLQKVESLNKYYEDLKDWNWRFGETPKFNHKMDTRFEWGGVEVHLDSHKGMIKDIKIYSDSLQPEMIEHLTIALKDKEYSSHGVQKALDSVIKELPFSQNFILEFGDWLKSEIS